MDVPLPPCIIETDGVDEVIEKSGTMAVVDVPVVLLVLLVVLLVVIVVVALAETCIATSTK